MEASQANKACKATVSPHLSKEAMANKAVSTAVMGLHQYQDGDHSLLHTVLLATSDDRHSVLLFWFDGVACCVRIRAHRVLVWNLQRTVYSLSYKFWD